MSFNDYFLLCIILVSYIVFYFVTKDMDEPDDNHPWC